MTLNLRIALAFASLFASALLAQDPVKPEPPKTEPPKTDPAKEKPFAEIIKGAQEIPGLFTLFRTEDKLYLEIKPD